MKDSTLRERPVAGDVIGYRRDGRPIRLAGGGSKDDDPGKDEKDDGGGEEGGGESDDTDTDDDGDDDDDEWTPPTKEEWERLKATVDKANNRARRKRLREKKERDSDDGGKGDDDGAKVRAETRKSLARAALLGELRGEGIGRAEAKLLVGAAKLSSIDFDGDEPDDDDVADEVERLKEEYPKLFGSGDPDEKKERKRGKGYRGSGKKGAEDGEPRSAVERLLANYNS